MTDDHTAPVPVLSRARPWAFLPGGAIVVLGLLVACVADPSGLAVLRLEVRPDTIRFRSLGDTVRVVVLEKRGTAAVLVPSATYEMSDASVAGVTSAGVVTSRADGTTHLIVRSPDGAKDSVAVVVVQEAVKVLVPRDTVELDALQAVAPIGAAAEDALGSPVLQQDFTYAVADTGIAAVAASGLVRAVANGVTAKVVVRVTQRPVRIAVGQDTVRFSYLGETRTITAQVVDSLDHPLQGIPVRVVSGDTSILEVVDSTSVRARKNGESPLRFEAGTLAVSQLGLVTQAPEQMTVTIDDTLPIQSFALDSLIPLRCRLLDHLGNDVVSGTLTEPQVLPSAGGRWSGTACSNLRIRASGLDTLRVVWDTLSASLPVVLAVRPIVSNVRALPLDSMPAGSGPWAPTLRRNSQGQVEVYATGYVSDSTYGGFRGHLHRYLSQDGTNFAYDGVAVTRDDSLCSLNGSGVENIAVVPRADGLGWRMFYAGGSFACYGWQVFSAVSTDERTWTKEPGIRIGNGLPLDQPTGVAPWPVGEGMVVDQLPTSEWRMIASTYEPVAGSDQKWQITEWRSWDQLSWTYVRTVFSTRQLPPEGQRSVYSPTIREIAPGLWRMIVTADNLNIPGGRSRLWSAVSTDEDTWQFEGELLGEVGGDYLYSSLLDDQLVFLHQTAGLPRVVGIATVQMP
jgi:hypothetical protein